MDWMMVVAAVVASVTVLVLVRAALLGMGLFTCRTVQLVTTPSAPALSAFELQVLRELVGCRGPLAASDMLPPLGFLLRRRALRCAYLFCGVVPWWARLLPRKRVRVLWSGGDTRGVERAGMVLCRTVAERRAAARLLQEGGRRDTTCVLSGFTSVPQRSPVLPEPAAARAEVSALYLGDAADLPAVLELWELHGDLPPLVVPPEGGSRTRSGVEDLDGWMAGSALHVLPPADDGFDLLLDRSSFHGALQVRTEPRSALPEEVRRLTSLPLEERAEEGRRSQEVFTATHRFCLEHFPRFWPELIFFTRRDPPSTGGQLYNVQMVQELRARHVDVRRIDLDDFQTLFGMIELWSVPFSLALAVVAPWHGAPFVVDQVYAFWLIPSLWIRSLLGTGKTVLLVHHLENYDSATSGWFDRWHNRLQLLPADFVITVSEFCRREVESLGVPAERIRVVSGGVHPDRLPAHRQRPVPSSPVRLLFVGGCDGRKGLLALVEALTLVEAGRFELHLVGRSNTGHCNDELLPLIERLGLGDVVHVEGYVTRERLAELYDRADAFVFPSFKEGYGLAALEAMFAGLPVLCSGTTALPELVEDGTHGYLFTPGDAPDIARVLERVLQDPGALPRMGLAAREKALTQSTWAESRARFCAVVEPLIR